MDKQVELALAKWPNVPHCYGWLALDARGVWRMRDQHAQATGALGSPIRNAALRAFINRNYLSDDSGCYYFQNGPQRVYVGLQATPYIAHHDPKLGWVTHTGDVIAQINKVWMTEQGNMILQNAKYLAQVDDRDMAFALTQVNAHGKAASDEQVMLWLAQPDNSLTFVFECPAAIELTTLEHLADNVPFVKSPQE